MVASVDVDGVDVIAGERGCKTSSAPVTYNPYKRQPLSASSTSSCPTCMTLTLTTARASAQSFHKMLANGMAIWLKHRIVACWIRVVYRVAKQPSRQNYYASASGPRIV